MSKMQGLLFVSFVGAVLTQGPSFAQQATGDSEEVADLKKQVEALKRENAFLQHKNDTFKQLMEELERRLVFEFKKLPKALEDALEDVKRVRQEKLESENAYRLKIEALDAARTKAEAERDELRKLLNNLLLKKNPGKKAPKNPAPKPLIAPVIDKVTKVEDKFVGVDVGSDQGAAADPNEVADLKRQLELLKRENAEARQKAAQALAELNRRAAEVAATRKTVDKLTKALLNSSQKLDALTKQLAQSEFERKTLQDRANFLLDDVMKLRVELATLQAKQGQDPKKQEAPNPPAQKVQGKVIKLDKENLIQINVGSDQGLQKDHTLEVFRLQPKAEYLGMLRILEVQTSSAVGRMLPISGKTKEIKEGDMVADSVR